MIRKFIPFAAVASLATLAVAAPSIASASEAVPQKVVYAGTQYSYTVTETPKGRMIVGKTSAGAPFKLAVSKYYVTGHYNNAPVTFKISEVKPMKGIVEVASR